MKQFLVSIEQVINTMVGWFPLSILMAESNDSQWEKAENIYGLAQDIGIGVLFIGILLL